MKKKKRPLFDIKGRLLDKFQKIVNIDAPAKEIALGMSWGIFVGWLPLMGIQMLFVLLLTFPFKKVNKPAALSGVWLSNPVTVLPIYIFIYWLGKFFYPRKDIFPRESIKETIEFVMETKGPVNQFITFLDLGVDVFVPMLIGGCIVGAISFFPVYFITKRVVITYRWKRRRSRSLKL